jgi:hypothetical protein
MNQRWELFAEMAGIKRYGRFSIFSCGCKQYKSVHVNSGAKIILFFGICAFFALKIVISMDCFVPRFFFFACGKK